MTFEPGLKGRAGVGASFGRGVGAVGREESPGQDSRLQAQTCGRTPPIPKCPAKDETLSPCGRRDPSRAEGMEASIREKLRQPLGKRQGRHSTSG